MLDYNQYFHRQIQLWGKNTQNLLKNKKVVIVGCGGLGCSLGIALGSSGIGQIDLVDFDTVSIHNIHRQIGFTIKDENKKKCEVLKKLIISRYPIIKINTFDIDFEKFITIKSDNYDLIIDATDNIPIRVKINQFSKKTNIPWIYGSVEAFHGQVCFFHNSSYESVFNISNHKPAGITAPIVMQIASLQANLALRFLASLDIKKDCLYYCYFDKFGEFKMDKFNLPIS